MNGFALSGDSELVFVGERFEGAFVGDEDGVPGRMAVAGEWLFCLRKGDCLPDDDSKGESCAESLLGLGEAMSLHYSPQWSVCLSVCGCDVDVIRVFTRNGAMSSEATEQRPPAPSAHDQAFGQQQQQPQIEVGVQDRTGRDPC